MRHLSHKQTTAGVAQMAERLSCNQDVAGSIPVTGSKQQGNIMEPTNNLIRYDAQTYEKSGFLEVRGRVRELAQEPRYWQVAATARTADPSTGERARHHFKFRTEKRYKLSELAPIINDRIHAEDDYLPDCLSVMVVARVMM